jgi:hypothetical protein
VRKRAVAVLAISTVCCAFAVVAADGRSRTGQLTGGIYLVGGPASPTGGSACNGTRCPGRGRIKVRDRRGAVVAHAALKQDQHYRFRLPAGWYTVSSGPACSSKRVAVIVEKTTTANISCSIK